MKVREVLYSVILSHLNYECSQSERLDSSFTYDLYEIDMIVDNYLDHLTFVATHFEVPMTRGNDSVCGPDYKYHHFDVIFHFERGYLEEHRNCEYDGNGDDIKVAEGLQSDGNVLIYL